MVKARIPGSSQELYTVSVESMPQYSSGCCGTGRVGKDLLYGILIALAVICAAVAIFLVVFFATNGFTNEAVHSGHKEINGTLDSSALTRGEQEANGNTLEEGIDKEKANIGIHEPERDQFEINGHPVYPAYGTNDDELAKPEPEPEPEPKSEADQEPKPEPQPEPEPEPKPEPEPEPKPEEDVIEARKSSIDTAGLDLEKDVPEQLEDDLKEPEIPLEAVPEKEMEPMEPEEVKPEQVAPISSTESSPIPAMEEEDVKETVSLEDQPEEDVKLESRNNSGDEMGSLEKEEETVPELEPVNADQTPWIPVAAEDTNLEIQDPVEVAPSLVPDVPEEVPVKLQDVLAESRDVPEALQDVPEPVQNVPEPVKDVPELVEDLPEQIQSIPEQPQNSSELLQEIPDTMQDVPDAVEEVPDAIEEVPEHENPVPEQEPGPAAPPMEETEPEQPELASRKLPSSEPIQLLEPATGEQPEETPAEESTEPSDADFDFAVGGIGSMAFLFPPAIRTTNSSTPQPILEPSSSTANETEVFKKDLAVFADIKQDQCITRNLAFCDGILPYSATNYPNWVGDNNEAERNLSVPYLQIITSSECNARVQHYACAVLEPPCVGGATLPPCRKFCKSVAEDCKSFILSDLSLAQVFDCDQFPDSQDPSQCLNLALAEEDGECLAGEYRCQDSSCIPMRSICDGIKDCSDGDDELTCDECEENEFRCASENRCISNKWRCDGSVDCADGTDELNCNPSECGEDQFRCEDGLSCIPKRWMCDGTNHCRDNSDERNCSVIACEGTDFKCRDSGICVQASWVCDGNWDCKDGSDEAGCLPFEEDVVSGSDNSTSTAADPDRCPLGELLCVSGSNCIRIDQLCDGTNDCADGADEKDCKSEEPQS